MKYNFPYTRTFNAIAAAVSQNKSGSLGISIAKFQEIFNNNESLGDLKELKDELKVGEPMRYASGETGIVCWLDEKWVLAYQNTRCQTPRLFHRSQCERA